MLVRRLMHREDWNSTNGGLPHNPSKNGVIYVGNKEDFQRTKASSTVCSAESLRSLLTPEDLRRPACYKCCHRQAPHSQIALWLLGQDSSAF